MNFLFNRRSALKLDLHPAVSLDLSDAPDLAGLEISGSIDPFVNLEEIAPELEWSEAIAAAWGLPSPDRSPSSNPFLTRLWSQLRPQKMPPAPVQKTATEYELA